MSSFLCLLHVDRLSLNRSGGNVRRGLGLFGVVPNLIRYLLLVSGLLASQLFAQDIRIVLAEGVGIDPQSAAQNAAQSALVQVVGSFIDTDTQLRKRTEVQNGIRSEIKQIDKSIREYSQGSISSFEVLETKQEGQLFKIVAKVGVRVAEFKAFIARVAEGEARVDGGLFVEAKTAVTQSQSLTDILTGRLQAIFDGSVQEFEVGQPILYPRSHFATLDNHGVYGAGGQALGAFVRSGGDPNTVIVVPVVARLSREPLDNFMAVLDGTSAIKKRFSCETLSSADYDCVLYDRKERFDSLTVILPFSRALSRRPSGIMYRFALRPTQVLDRLNLPDELFSSFLRPSAPSGRYPNLRLSINSASGSELMVEEISGADWASRDDGPFVLVESSLLAYDGLSVGPPWLLSHGYIYGRSGGLIVVSERKFYLAFSVDLETLKHAASVKIAIERH